MKNFVPNDNFNWLFYWCCERMNIFWKKYNGEQNPWTEDEILNTYKFTNVYRVLDRVSQYLVNHVIYTEKQYTPEDMFFRILLFRHLNKIETWQYLEQHGDVCFDTADGIVDALTDRLSAGHKIYNGCFMITSRFYQNDKFAWLRGYPKHEAYMRIWNREIFQSGRIYDFLESSTFEQLLNNFKAVGGGSVGIYSDFTAQQHVLDMNYSPLFNFSENDFVVLGPGSKRGVIWTFGAGAEKHGIDILKWVQEHFEEYMQRFCNDTGMVWNPLPWEPVPTLTNLQNCFCELGKYARCIGDVNFKAVAKRPKCFYTPFAGGKEQYMFPPKMGVKMPAVGEVKPY